MKRKVTGFLLTGILLCAGAVFAQQPQQEQPQQEPAKKALDTSLKVSGVIYSEYAWSTGYQPGGAWTSLTDGTPFGVTDDNKEQTFRVQRVYLNFRKNFTESISMRVTTDVNAGTSSNGMNLYLKYAYFQYQDTFFDFMKVNVQAGLVGTPIIGLLDDISDCRWIYQNLYDKSANLLRGQTFDSSADFGVRLSLTFFNMVTLTGAVVNGEGYKTIPESFDGKAYYAAVTVNPISSIYINGFFRYEDDIADNTATSTGVSSEVLYGFGAAYKSDLVNAGIHTFFLWDNNKEQTLRRHSSYIMTEAYLMANLGAVIPSLPLLIHGRYGYGVQFGSDIQSLAEDHVTQMYAAGLGWQFTPGLRVLAYYEAYTYEAEAAAGYDDPPMASNFMVKCEVKF